MTNEQMLQLGLCRFGVPVTDLIQWHSLRKQARMRLTEARRLIRIGKLYSASHTLWYGTFDPVCVDDTLFQRFLMGKWRSAKEKA